MNLENRPVDVLVAEQTRSARYLLANKKSLVTIFYKATVFLALFVSNRLPPVDKLSCKGTV